jgi:ATP-dependent Clp protease ATP-binding subunit ClpB
MTDRIAEALRDGFKPEFLNRIDETIVFESLTPDQIGDIVSIQIERLRKRLAPLRMDLTLSGSAAALLVERGYDPAFGARPLKRAIQKYIENPLSLAILEGRIPEGSRIRVDADGDGMAFTAAPAGRN